MPSNTSRQGQLFDPPSGRAQLSGSQFPQIEAATYNSATSAPMPARTPAMAQYNRDNHSSRGDQAFVDPDVGGYRGREGHQKLPMFMTPNQITSQYQVLDGDREDYYDHNGSDRAWERTERSRRTGGQRNMRNSNKDFQADKPGNYVRTPRTETDDEVFARKADEARLPNAEYAEYRGESGMSGTFRPERVASRASYPAYPTEGSKGWVSTSRHESWEMRENSYLERKADSHANRYNEWADDSIYDSVAREGVKSPITLSTQFKGSQGKQQILGGHHRLASALETRPNSYLPVVHAENLYDAKSDPYQKYT